MDRIQRMLTGMGGGGGGGPPGDTPQVDTAEQIYISSLALLKMLKHGESMCLCLQAAGGIHLGQGPLPAGAPVAKRHQSAKLGMHAAVAATVSAVAQAWSSCQLTVCSPVSGSPAARAYPQLTAMVKSCAAVSVSQPPPPPAAHSLPLPLPPCRPCWRAHGGHGPDVG